VFEEAQERQRGTCEDSTGGRGQNLQRVEEKLRKGSAFTRIGEARNRGARRGRKTAKVETFGTLKFSQGRKKAQGGSGESTDSRWIGRREIWTVEEIYVQEEPQQVETATRIWTVRLGADACHEITHIGNSGTGGWKRKAFNFTSGEEVRAPCCGA
jgi:hypothetical protein